jgi:hypothetical protein
MRATVTLYSIQQVASCTIAVAANFSAALYSTHEFVRLVCEESMLSRLLILLFLFSG